MKPDKSDLMHFMLEDQFPKFNDNIELWERHLRVFHNEENAMGYARLPSTSIGQTMFRIATYVVWRSDLRKIHPHKYFGHFNLLDRDISSMGDGDVFFSLSTTGMRLSMPMVAYFSPSHLLEVCHITRELAIDAEDMTTGKVSKLYLMELLQERLKDVGDVFSIHLTT